jgi:hypothetical protein
MAKTALGSLQDQIESIRREAYAAGYAAAMQAVRELASRPSGRTAPAAAVKPASAAKTAAAAKQVLRRTRSKVAAAKAVRPAAKRTARRAAARTAAAATAPAPKQAAVAKAVAKPPGRGNNARMVEEMLKSIAPRAARPTDIRNTLRRERGVAMAFTSIRHALNQLEGRKSIERVGDSKTWRYRPQNAGAAAKPA